MHAHRPPYGVGTLIVGTFFSLVFSPLCFSILNHNYVHQSKLKHIMIGLLIGNSEFHEFLILLTIERAVLKFVVNV